MADIINGDFAAGLAGWRVGQGSAFDDQPVPAAIGAVDVLIDGHLPVTLGGDYWHTTSYPLGALGMQLIRVVGSADGGTLESDEFEVTSRFLVFGLGGTRDGGTVELRIRGGRGQGGGRPPKAERDGFATSVRVRPAGSDVLVTQVIDLDDAKVGRELQGATAKVRLTVPPAGGNTAKRLLVDDIRLLDARPDSVPRPVWGWADIHCHPMAHAGFGDLLAGHIHGPVEDVGSCAPVHGHRHTNPLHPTGMALDDHVHHNDGSGPGWPSSGSITPAQHGFQGWPAFDEITHLKTHQDWIRRAYEGGLRLMVALVVHNQLMAACSTLSFEGVQSDRDTIEPQVQMLREFVAHNHAWCGWARTPQEARQLIEDGKMAFVLGLETDTINNWAKLTDLPNNEDDSVRDIVLADVHERIHCYFKYLHDLGVVQVNLLHLIDNAFGGMALYDYLFYVNCFIRTGSFPHFEDGFRDSAGQVRPVGERTCQPLTGETFLWDKVQPLLTRLGVTLPAAVPAPAYGEGIRNVHGLSPAGQEALLEAMRFAMVIDLDHMSEKATHQAHTVATQGVPNAPYPLVCAHNGARIMAMDPPAQRPNAATVPASPDERRNAHTWANESLKSETQLGFVAETGGMFGHGVAGADSKPYGPVANDAPGTSKTVAQGLYYVMHRLGELTSPAVPDNLVSVGLGTDWNVLLGGPGPRFGPRAVHGLTHELDPAGDAWAASIRSTRWGDAEMQGRAVAYATPLRDWRSHRFGDNGRFADQPYGEAGRFVWQALALGATGVDLTDPDVVVALEEPGWGKPALDLALGLQGGAAVSGSVYFDAGARFRDPTFPIGATGADPTEVLKLVAGLTAIKPRWDAIASAGGPPLTRSTAGGLRDFDYNLDGLAHYGMLPDMLQDLKNVNFPTAAFDAFFGSAERYLQVWERSLAVAATIPHPPVKTPCT